MNEKEINEQLEPIIKLLKMQIELAYQKGKIEALEEMKITK